MRIKNNRYRLTGVAIILLIHVGSLWADPLHIKVDIVRNPTVDTETDGAVYVTIEGGMVPYSYFWTQGGRQREDTSGLAVGTYTLTVTDALDSTFTTEVGVGYSVANWTNQLNINTSGDTIKSTYPYNYSGGAGASSDRILHSGTNGWAEYTITELTERQTFGFAPMEKTGYSNADFQHAWYIDANVGAKLYVIKNGSTVNINENYQIGDVLRVERVSDTMHYKVNGKTLYQYGVDLNEN